MSSFVQDNLDRFSRIQGDYNNIANSIGRLTNSDNKEDDLKSRLELAGGGIESGANLYMEGRRMIHDLHSRKLGKDFVSELKRQGEKNIEQLKTNRSSLAEQLKSSKPKSVRSRPGGGDQGGGDQGSSSVEETTAPKATTPEQLSSNIETSQQRLDRLSQPSTVDTDVPEAGETLTNPSLAQVSRGEFAEGGGVVDPKITPPPAPGEAPPAEDLARNVSAPTEDSDPYVAARSVSSEPKGRVAPDDEGSSSVRSSGTATAAEQSVEDEASTASKSATRAAELGAEAATEEEVGSALDTVPGADIVGLALNAIGGITAAVGGALPGGKPEEAPKPPKPVSIGGDFSPSVVSAGGTTA